MKLILVCEFFYPYKTGTQKILTELAEDLVEYGLEIEVLTTKNSYREESQKVEKQEVYKGIDIKRIFSTDKNRDSKVGRILNYLTFTISVFLNLLTKRNYEKVLLVSNPPLLPYIGYIIKKIRRKDYIYLVHDIYPDVAEKLGVIKEGCLISRVMNYINNKIYNNAEKVIALGKDMKEVIVNKGIEGNKVKIITNWADSKVIYEKEIDMSFCENHGLKNKFNILYTGNISKVHDIDTIIDTARVLKDEKDVKFTFAGSGNRKQYVVDLIKSEGLNNIQVIDYMFGEEYNNLLNCANVFVTTLNKELKGLGVPSKTYTYMALGKPLIAIMDKSSEIGSMVNKYNLGRQFETNNSQAIVQFIYQLKNNGELYNKISDNVRKKFKDDYERKKVTEKFYNVIISS